MTLSRKMFAATLATSALACSAIAAPHYEATITRTTYGIPHVKANNVASAGFGAAYAEAQDNVCLLADAYLSASGERSKYLGPDAMTKIAVWPARNIDNDIYYRSLADDATLRASFARLTPEARALVDGWVAGYNRFLADHRGKLPAACNGQAWVRTIGRDQVLRWMNGFALFSSSSGLGVALANTAPPSSTAARRDQPRLASLQVTPELLGSNGWAFGGDATKNGRGLVVGNPHFPWFGPYRFYEMHLTVPGKLDIAGAGIIGQPFVGIGFNKDVAWTHTVDTAVHMTLSKLSLDPADPTAYLVDGKSEKMTRRTLTIETKGGAPVTHTLYASRFGPIVVLPGTAYAWTRQTAYAVTDANDGNVRSTDTYLALARATGVEDVRAALITYRGGGFLNTIAADRRGTAMFADISPAPNLPDAKFAACGTIAAKLPAFYSAFYVLDGSRAGCGWDKSGTLLPSLYPGDKMATILRRDFVQNSNDSYRWTNPAVGHADRALMLGRDPGALPDLRTRSGLQEIGLALKAGKLDIDSAAATMLGNKNFAGQLMLPAMLELCKRPTAASSGNFAEACAALAKWDGKAELDSRAAALFMLFWTAVKDRPDLWTVPFDPADPVRTPSTPRVDGATGDALLAALATAAETVKKLGIALDAPVGSFQFADRGAEHVPISGAPAGGVLNYMAGLPTPAGFSVVHGSSYIQSVTFDDKGPVAKAVLTYSQSTDPASPHYADQTRAFSKKQLHIFPFSDAEIAADRIGEPLTIRQ